jgi:hypothetical protein
MNSSYETASMEKVVAIIAYRRYEYLRRVLEALAGCDGIDTYNTLIHVDPGSTAVEDLARYFPLPNKEVVVNPHQYGCNGNIYAACAHAFSLTDYAVIIEDDIVPARDALRFFEYVDNGYRNDPSCFGACAYHREDAVPHHSHAVIHNRNCFTPWGWATWRDRWEQMAAAWPLGDYQTSWDVVMTRYVLGSRYQVHPRLGRAQNIGAKGGTFCPSEAFHAKNQFNPHWAGARTVPPGDFHP